MIGNHPLLWFVTDRHFAGLWLYDHDPRRTLTPDDMAEGMPDEYRLYYAPIEDEL